MTNIHGYTYGTALAPSPVSIAELDLLKQTVLWTEDDTAALRQAGEILADQIDDVLDVWYGYVGAHPHLVRSFSGPDGQPSSDDLDAVRQRFGQWIRDLCGREWDTDWLAYQNEIAQRHVNTMGKTDAVSSAETHVAQRYLIAFVFPITATIRDFLAAPGRPANEVDAMHAAWFKAVTLTVVLWSQPYNPQLW